MPDRPPEPRPNPKVMPAEFGLAIFSMLAISAVYVLRWKQSELHRPFRTPGSPFTPAVYLIVAAVLTSASFSQCFLVSTYSLLGILAGVPLYDLRRPRAPKTSVDPDR